MLNFKGTFPTIKKFLRDQSGNYGIIFGLVLFPVIGSVALAVD